MYIVIPSKTGKNSMAPRSLALKYAYLRLLIQKPTLLTLKTSCIGKYEC